MSRSIQDLSLAFVRLKSLLMAFVFICYLTHVWHFWSCYSVCAVVCYRHTGGEHKVTRSFTCAGIIDTSTGNGTVGDPSRGLCQRLHLPGLERFPPLMQSSRVRDAGVRCRVRRVLAS
ncbi:unnamed protein product [Ectocarpus sp. 12 AP-2014]